jgi:alpha-amylase
MLRCDVQRSNAVHRPSFIRLFLVVAVAFSSVQSQIARAAPRRLEDEIIYVVIWQKFANGDPSNDVMASRFADRREILEGGFWGGDLAGLNSKLDYLVDLGVTALLLYPVVRNDQHPMGQYLPTGYRPRDYFRVDENLGSLQELKSFVEEAHRRDLRVFLDLPLGMPGFEYPELRELSEKEWLGPATRYGLRQWNTDNPDTANFLIRVGMYWRDQTGCDGFRLDSAQFHQDKFWRRFVREMKRGRDDEFVILAELPSAPAEIERSMRAAGFDGAYDFSAGIGREVFGLGQPVEVLSAVLRDSASRYATPRSMLAQIDNYEEPAFLDKSLEPKHARLKMALTYLLTLDRVPLIYPGNEQGLLCKSAADLWSKSPEHQDSLDWSRRLIALRRDEPALRRGTYEEVFCKQPTFAFVRRIKQDRILVVFNVSDEMQDLKFEIDDKCWKDLQVDDLLKIELIKRRSLGAPIQVNPFSTGVFRVSADS